MMIDRCYIEITNTCNLNCHFCPKHSREKRQLTAEEFNQLTDKLKGKVCFLYFHLMGEPLLHPLLPQFITTAREKGFKTVLTSNGTLLHRAMELLDTLPHKIQLSLHSHESNAKGELSSYMDEVMTFSTQAAAKGTCIVLRLWNQGGRDKENEEIMRLIENMLLNPGRNAQTVTASATTFIWNSTENSNGPTSKTISGTARTKKKRNGKFSVRL